jgi:hypothetical protein
VIFQPMDSLDNVTLPPQINRPKAGFPPHRPERNEGSVILGEMVRSKAGSRPLIEAGAQAHSPRPAGPWVLIPRALPYQSSNG